MAAIDRLTSATEALRRTDTKGQNATLAQMVRTLPPLFRPCTQS